MTRSFFAVLVVAFLIWILAAIVAVRAGAAVTVTTTPDGDPVAPAPSGLAPSAVPALLPAPVAQLEIAALHRRVAFEHHRYLATVRQLRHRWRPTVEYAIRLASSATGVPAGDLYAVARCESGLSPFASNGRYLGLFQLGWAPFGFSPFDPIANALSAAMTVQRDGGWRQWECKP